MKILAILLALAVSGLLWMQRTNSTLTRSLASANHITSQQKSEIVLLNSQLRAAGQLARRNESAQVTLREQLANVNEEARRREQDITRLLNENKAFQHWYNAQLPDAVRRVHIRPACASAGDCHPGLPKGEPVPNAGK
ncbi:MAG: Rz-like lysis system protein LysB [Yokenella regensburgei]|jgi:LysB family phage lysis regulatory protein|uniref:LysB family phage lysis regulatory protein n=1 Tax=Yokenella regensburgei TaxID=158877 RepID=A0ABX9RZ88_9ENTR|nr:Rz-like lysis system protein LysB [Yokenella regensburgei]EHM50637.1 phage lysis regulatory protein, LysB family [Yokenella regensburgei ATCC 43003]MDR3106443.1 Rz-like lysis system protein LysB [Yokenella regensburgei]RKR54194.1 LysB family phage lysis regulatory protein [Yokenella regensburgei]VFS30430.1 phage lysis regulatory protein, LysB family [Yokenella regensburgei]